MIVLVAAQAATPVSLAQLELDNGFQVFYRHDVGLIGASHASQGGRITNSYVPTGQVG